ncbi:outer membrane protein assembly factor BamE [Pelistega europaea]|uniref:Outer membrane protein assembly factor BamE n=1 Tax=Pelistega europaea TaxID=106147 RepID=A0A7Y4L9L8_9BURK|nr:outer membrane protein assembly factor BamE [Pelistega europaea]NOL49564.1 outer membrane protein assembly factor BamE [Pelistega europaea]
MNNQYPTLRLRKGLIASSLLAVTLLTACTSGKWGFPYRAPVQQGNWITEEQVSLLQPGMTPAQVQYALGSPTLIDMFHKDRWYYSYYFKPGYGDPVLRKFVVWFDDKGLLSHWDGDPQPSFQPSDYATQQRWRPEMGQSTKQESEESTEAESSGVITTPLK